MGREPARRMRLDVPVCSRVGTVGRGPAAARWPGMRGSPARPWPHPAGWSSGIGRAAGSGPSSFIRGPGKLFLKEPRPFSAAGSSRAGGGRAGVLGEAQGDLRPSPPNRLVGRGASGLLENEPPPPSSYTWPGSAPEPLGAGIGAALGPEALVAGGPGSGALFALSFSLWTNSPRGEWSVCGGGAGCVITQPLGAPGNGVR